MITTQNTLMRLALLPRLALLTGAALLLAGADTAADLRRQARDLFNEKRYSESLAVLQRSLALNARDAEAYKLIALDAIRLDRLDVAEPALRSAAEIAPGDFAPRFHLGALLFTKGLFESARLELEKAIQLNPEYMPSHVFLGLALEELGSEQTALASYRRAIQMADRQGLRSEMPSLSLGRLLYRLDRVDESLPPLKRAAELNPSSADAWLALGKTLFALSRNAEAVDALARSEALDPDQPDTHYVLARVYTATGRSEDAAGELRRFQTLQRKPGRDPRRRLIGAASPDEAR
jgi:tetratricopeptide (TPR) repeat protein